LERGNVYNRQKDYDRAIADISKAIEIDPKDAGVYFFRGRVYFGKGDAKNAVADYSKVIEIEPKNAKAYFTRGFVFHLVGQDDEAVADFDKVIELTPKGGVEMNGRFSDAYYWKGWTEQQRGNFAQAETSYKKRLEHDPTNQEMKEKLKFLAVDRTRCQGTRVETTYWPKKKVIQCDLALAEDDGSISDVTSSMLMERGAAYGELEKHDLALADFNRAIDLASDWSLPWVERGRFYRKTGELTKAMADLDHATEVEPDDFMAWHERGILHRIMGDFDKSLSDLDESVKNLDFYIETFGDDVFADRALTHVKRGEYGEAVADYTKALEFDPEFGENYYFRGVAYQELGAADAAIADFQKALSIEPDMKRASDALEKLNAPRLTNPEPPAASDPPSKREASSSASANAECTGAHGDARFRACAGVVEDDSGSEKLFESRYDSTKPPIAKSSETKPVGKLNGSSEAAEIAFWNSVKDSDDANMLQAYLDRFPDGIFSTLAKLKLDKQK